MIPESGNLAGELQLEEKKRPSRLKIISCMAGVGVIAFIIAQNLFVSMQPFPHIRADKYVAPQRCEQKRYGEMEDISRSCLVDRYKLSYLFQSFHNLNNRGARGQFYRIGDDIVKVSCSFVDDSCTVQAVTPDVYYS